MNRLLSINNYYYRRAGAEAVYLDHNALLEREGWSVVPFAMHHPDNLQSEWSDHFAEEIEFGFDYSLSEKVRKAAKTVYSFEAKKKLANLIEQVRPTICHAHNIYHHLSPAILSVVKQRGIPLFLTTHDLKIACPAYKMLTSGSVCERCKGGAFRHVVLNRCVRGSSLTSLLAYAEAHLHKRLRSYEANIDRFVVPSQFYIEKFVEWGFRREQMAYIPNAIDVEQFSPRRAAGEGFLYLGRLAPEKGVDTLIRASAQSGQPVRIAGSGPEEEALKHLAASLDAPITFLGHQPAAAIGGLIAEARALVLPSQWYENAPISVLEAYATGVPVIGAEIGGIPELVQNDVTGVTFESRSVDALAAKLEQLASLSSAEVLRMGEAAREMVETRYSRSQYRQRMLALYQEYLRG